MWRLAGEMNGRRGKRGERRKPETASILKKTVPGRRVLAGFFGSELQPSRGGCVDTQFPAVEYPSPRETRNKHPEAADDLVNSV